MGIDAGRLYAFAWRAAPRVPEPVLRAAFTVGADAAWLLRLGGVDQLERNLRRVRPAASDREIRRLSRAGMRSYLRYFREAFTLSAIRPDQLPYRVRLEGDAASRADLAAGRSVALALGHLGNWDLAGAWSTGNLGPVVTVAERLEPASLFEEFVAFREGLGMEILAFGDDGVFRTLVRRARDGGRVIPLLADRDLSHHGIEVTWFGERARVAAGPAALAVATGVPLHAVGIFYERLHGARRRAAGSPWGLVARFGERLEADPSLRGREAIAELTQRWVTSLEQQIVEQPEDWHMLQKVFVADLDADRYARTREAAGETARGSAA